MRFLPEYRKGLNECTMLSKEKDPMGHAISDFQNSGKSKKLWVFSDISERDEIPVDYLFRNYDQMPEIEQMALKACRGKILDVGAAAGSHSLWLSSKGFNVTSIDISILAVEIMQKRGLNDVKCVDFFSISKEIKYDTLLFLMNGAGIAGLLKNLSNLLSICRKLLSINGQILIDSSDIKYMFDTEDDKPTDKYYGEVEYTMSYGDCKSDTFNWLFVGFDLLREIANQNGFSCEKVYEGENHDYLAKLALS